MRITSMPEAPTATPYTKLYAYDAGGNLEYAGWAKPGALSSEPYWAIKKFTYAGNNLAQEQWANGTTAETNVWDNRAALTYA